MSVDYLAAYEALRTEVAGRDRELRREADREAEAERVAAERAPYDERQRFQHAKVHGWRKGQAPKPSPDTHDAQAAFRAGQAAELEYAEAVMSGRVSDF